MLVDLNLQDKRVLIMGEGEELEIRTRQLLDAGAKVIVASSQFSRSLKRLTKPRRVRLLACNYHDEWESLLRKHKPYAVVLVTTDKESASEIAKSIRARRNAIIYAVDMPHLNDFNMLATAKLGDIRVAISTGGISPAMARILRQKIERTITPEDIRGVQLQAIVRRKIRRRIPTSELRRICIYRIIRDKRIKESIRTGKLDEAEKLATKQIELIARKASS